MHTYCNPLNKERFETFLRLLCLDSSSNVVDFACGKGEFLIRMAELYNVRGTGIDISPYFLKDARAKAKSRVPNASLTFIQLDAKEYKQPEHQLFDLTSCMGATWIWNGYSGTLQALTEMTRPGGTIIVGEPYWLKTPSSEYLEADNLKKETFADSHYDNVKVGEALGLTCIYTMVSTQQDFDDYETLTWMAITDYAEANPTDPDVEEILKRMEHEKHVYLQWQRDTLGWALYTYRKSNLKEHRKN